MTRTCGYRMIPTVVLLTWLALFFVVLNSYALENQDPESADTKSKKERLVASDIGFGFSNIRWCGNDRLLLYGNTRGLKLIDLTTGKWTTVSKDGSDYPVECTNDGKWVIYIDRKSWRIDKGRVAPPDEELEGEIEWQGFVENLYRYEVLTGKRQIFAVVRDRPNPLNIVSPDGSKVFLGNRHNTKTRMPEPAWETFWFTKEWDYAEPHWLADSSGVVTLMWEDKSIVVEILGQKGWSKVYKWDSDIKGNINHLDVNGRNKIYFLESKDYSEGKTGRSKHRIYSCDIKNSELNCQRILELDLKYTNIKYVALTDGDIVYKESDDKCIRRFSQSHAKTECVVDGPDLGRFYGLSPDGSWIVYERYGKEEKKSNRYDLFILEINH